MVVLKTFSQLKSFYKRMARKRNFYFDEGCGCCSMGAEVKLDVEKQRVLLHHYGENRGEHSNSCEVIAVIKVKSR